MLKLVSVARAANRRIGDARHYDRLTLLRHFDTTLVVPFGGKPSEHPMARDGKLAGLDLRFVPLRLPRLANLGDGLHTVHGLRQIILETQPDVIHVNEEPHTLLAFQVARMRERLAPRAALVLESELGAGYVPPATLRLTERGTLAKADALITRHRAAIESRRARGFAGHGAVIEYAVDRAVFNPSRRAEARQALQASMLTLGYVGRLSSEGGLIEVIEAMAASRVPVQLMIMGRGELRDELADRAMVLKMQDRVRFFEPKAPEDVAFFLNAVDLLVAISRPVSGLRDPFDRAVAEAQACGVPVIASDLGMLPDLVGQAGWVVDAGDAGMLAQLLARLAEDPGAIAAARAQAVRQAQARFDLGTIASQFEHELQAVCGRQMVSAFAETTSHAAPSAAMRQRVEL